MAHEEEQGLGAQQWTNADFAVATVETAEESSDISLVPHEPVDSIEPDDCCDVTTGDQSQCRRPGQEQPYGSEHVDEVLRRQARSSAPPECLRDVRHGEVVRMNNYLDRFSSDILPPPTMPAYLQILTYMQRWGLWAAHIADDGRRVELIKMIAEKMENVWMYGMRRGLIPQTVEELNGQGDEVSARCPGADHSFSHKVATDIVGAQQQQQKHQKARKATRPVCEIAIKSLSTERPRFPVSLGELEDAGLSMREIEEQLNRTDLPGREDGSHGEHGGHEHEHEHGHDILQETVERVGRDICQSDWHCVAARTTRNPFGRDLRVYCLWEMQRLRDRLKGLEQLKQRFRSQNQVRNTQMRIDAAKALHARYAAVASLLHARRKEGKETTPPPSSHAESAGGGSEHENHDGSNEAFDSDESEQPQLEDALGPVESTATVTRQDEDVSVDSPQQLEPTVTGNGAEPASASAVPASEPEPERETEPTAAPEPEREPAPELANPATPSPPTTPPSAGSGLKKLRLVVKPPQSGHSSSSSPPMSTRGSGRRKRDADATAATKTATTTTTTTTTTKRKRAPANTRPRKQRNARHGKNIYPGHPMDDSDGDRDWTPR